MTTVAQLTEIPYFDPTAWVPNRFVGPLIFYVEGEWHGWLPTPDALIKIKMTPAQAGYFGDKPERETDWYSLLLDILHQSISYPSLARAMSGIWGDIQNLATSLAKIHMFFEASLTRKDVTRFALTEVEYMVMVCRSIFDLLQEIIGVIWKDIELKDKPKHKKALPKSFADVLFRSNEEQSAMDISARFGLIPALSEWYVSQRPFFVELRSLRDKMAHGGRESIDTLFSTERGFAVSRTERPWCLFHDWPAEVELPNQLVPLRPALCAMVKKAVEACDSFATVLLQNIGIPRPLFPSLHYFSRGYSDRELTRIEDIITKSLWCYKAHPAAMEPASSSPDAPPTQA